MGLIDTRVALLRPYRQLAPSLYMGQDMALVMLLLFD